ncbi:DUF3426 domain-containing protein [Pseudodesulfovibrio sp. JC047]|uniref:DUF3426 domain-containing protein n=1 Tax=Pseudodesulfovibrio sp. JC047 TaxID=2683199 RepID=UPI0013D46DE3|nr:DUF3426 domain-containing protein [Pseudodesulfovibrio sp. JC047]NDV20318.1 DUF3426 domain-containing protein [Pseudodesulfovibrio sp. JC047]
MIVTCPNCETRYNLPDDKIPAGGAKVKCSKCAQVFKAELPPVTPEEEVEALLDEDGQGGETQAGDAFDQAFQDVAAGEAPSEEVPSGDAEVPEEQGDEISDEPTGDDSSTDEPQDDPFAGFDLPSDSADTPDDSVDTDDLPDTDDLFDDAEASLPDPDEGSAPSPSIGEDEDIFAGLDDESDEDDESTDLFEDADDDDDDAEDGDDLFIDDDDEDDSVFDETLTIEEDSQPRNNKSLGCLITLLVIVLAAGGIFYFKAWTYVGIDVGDMLKNVPFVGQLFTEETDGGQDTAPGESPAERVRKIELQNVTQYYVPNEKVGNLFVVEGKAVNKFVTAKELVKVEVLLYDETNNILTSQAFLCGNVLSRFQLQVQTRKEIEDGLASDVGVLSNNTFIRPDASTPFMAVFFEPPEGIKEFMVKVVDVGDPE